ncbi:integrase catalytic domain-containing protein [Trichonephila clavipes]|uniref:Integrase catalytic domain-containing protein n=1 Tax=Trichonephila clavipes TaxID=2585209 RepID=A0A8X6S9T6_TRICX|nr:integrase catalytic domain-containing protein [Trichonephila clavipes]
MSEEYRIKEIQKETYVSEIINLEKVQNVSGCSKIRSLAPCLDDRKFLRIKGRLDESELSLDEKQPIILPSNSKFTELLILYEHTKNFHSGVTTTLVILRRKFWIPKRRQLIKKVIKKDLICRKYSLKPTNQITAQLPKDRLLENPLFEVSGLDFVGPILYKWDKEVKKCYFAIFTRAVTRVEIEYIVNSRPLTYVTDDIYEPNPLIHLNFLQYGRKNHDYPLHFAELTNKLPNRASSITRKQYQTTLLKHFWNKWRTQSLLDLKTVHHFKSPSIPKDVKIGDVDLVEGSSKSKLLWEQFQKLLWVEVDTSEPVSSRPRRDFSGNQCN